jgi:membrane-bound lytic murein transglycosylase F
MALLVWALLTTFRYPPPLIEQVRELGSLRVVTRNAPTAYFIGVTGPTGPEYDLVRGFAEDLGVALDMRPLDRFEEIIPAVSRGIAHMAAAGLSITEERLAAVNFSQPYQQVEQHLVYRRGTGKPQSIEDIIDKQIVVMAGASHSDTLRALQAEHPALTWQEARDTEAAELLSAVARAEIDYTVADSTDFNIHRNFHPELRIALDLEVADSVAWAFRPGDDTSLVEAANAYLQKVRRNGQLTRILDRYYGHNDDFDYVGTRSFIRHYQSRLPRFLEWFQSAASEQEVDWRLLAAMGYQESHWRTKAVSPTGVRGIMMLTQATAEYLGIDNRLDPELSIRGGARFFRTLKDRLPDSIKEPDRTWMALAAYNVGYWHLMDAREIVRMQDGDPDRWIDVSDALPLLARKKWYSRVDYGYARGWEAVQYVENIRNYLDILRWLSQRDESGEPADAQPAESAPEDAAGEVQT